jgi:rhodanese-related sulfurtransferase
MEQFVEFVIKNWYLFAALAVILVLLIGAEVLRKVRGVSNVSPTDALQLINDQDAIVVDIREAGEYKQGHIPEARHIPSGKLKERLGELQKFKDKPVILYCRTGATSSGAGALLKKQGFGAVHNLSGGLPAWQNANLPISKR